MIWLSFSKKIQKLACRASDGVCRALLVFETSRSVCSWSLETDREYLLSGRMVSKLLSIVLTGGKHLAHVQAVRTKAKNGLLLMAKFMSVDTALLFGVG